VLKSLWEGATCSGHVPLAAKIGLHFKYFREWEIQTVLNFNAQLARRWHSEGLKRYVDLHVQRPLSYIVQH
jgi:hypothetical protein